MKILIAGATGFIGRALTLRLLRDGHRVTAWVRDPRRAVQALGDDVELVASGSADGSLERAIGEADAVVNLAGAPVGPGRWTAKRKQAIVDSRIDVTERLVRAIKTSERPPAVLICASAVGFYGDGGTTRKTERDGSGEDFLARLCRRWEQTAAGAREAGTRVVSLRIGVVLGAEGGVLATLVPLYRAGLGGRMGSGGQFVPWIHLDDLLEVIVTALEDPRLTGAVNAVSPSEVTSRQLTRLLARELGRPAFLALPAWVLRLLLGEAADSVLFSYRVSPAKLVHSGFAFRFADLRHALRDVLGATEGLKIGRLRREPGSSTSSRYLARRRPRYELRQQTLIDAPLDQVFAFFSRAENLGALTPPGLRFSITTALPLSMAAGTRLDYRIGLGPLPMRWQTEIESWQSPRRFVDVQLRGPYRCWWHEHRFGALGDQTLMEDRVLYAPPLGPLGRVAHRLWIAPMLRRIFGFRARAIRLRFGRTLPLAAARAA